MGKGGDPKDHNPKSKIQNKIKERKKERGGERIPLRTSIPTKFMLLWCCLSGYCILDNDAPFPSFDSPLGGSRWQVNITLDGLQESKVFTLQ
jgi:hypothetical protein